jgi:hypothetical protein
MMMFGNSANGGEVNDPTIYSFFNGTQLSKFEFASRAVGTHRYAHEKAEDHY